MEQEDEIIKVLLPILSRYTKKQQIKTTSLLHEELDLDSLEIIGLLFLIEQEFNIFVDSKEIQNWETVNDIIDFINRNRN